MNLCEHVKDIEEKYQAGQNLFRRQSVGFLLERISQLEQSTQQRKRRSSSAVCMCISSFVNADGICQTCLRPRR